MDAVLVFFFSSGITLAITLGRWGDLLPPSQREVQGYSIQKYIYHSSLLIHTHGTYNTHYSFFSLIYETNQDMKNDLFIPQIGPDLELAGISFSLSVFFLPIFFFFTFLSLPETSLLRQLKSLFEKTGSVNTLHA